MNAIPYGVHKISSNHSSIHTPTYHKLVHIIVLDDAQGVKAQVTSDVILTDTSNGVLANGHLMSTMTYVITTTTMIRSSLKSPHKQS